MAYYLGIDGGGSKTTCVVGDESSLLAAVTSGGSNITRVGEAGAREALQQAIREACLAARINPQQVFCTCIGAAGAGRAEIASTVRKIVAEIIPGEIEVVGDMEIALAAAFGKGPGVIVIAGTGSIVFGRDAQGKVARAGGWGFAISDEGSAHWIGLAAARAVLRAADEVGEDQAERDRSWPARRLFSELKMAWSLDSLPQLARAANARPGFRGSVSLSVNCGGSWGRRCSTGYRGCVPRTGTTCRDRRAPAFFRSTFFCRLDFCCPDGHGWRRLSSRGDDSRTFLQ